MFCVFYAWSEVLNVFRVFFGRSEVYYVFYAGFEVFEVLCVFYTRSEVFYVFYAGFVCVLKLQHTPAPSIQFPRETLITGPPRWPSSLTNRLARPEDNHYGEILLRPHSSLTPQWASPRSEDTSLVCNKRALEAKPQYWSDHNYGHRQDINNRILLTQESNSYV